MKVLGITGNIGSGKSYISSLLIKRGIPYYNCDNRSKYIFNNDESVQSKIVSLLGVKAYNNGVFDRDFVAKKVLIDNTILNKIENILKQPISDDINTFKAQFADRKILCLESAILLQTDLKIHVDSILLITANLETKKERIKLRDPFRKDDEINMIFNNQLSEEDMLKVCNYSIYNVNKNDVELNLELDKILSNFENSF